MEQQQLELHIEQKEEFFSCKEEVARIKNLIKSQEEIHNMVIRKLRDNLNTAIYKMQSECIHPDTTKTSDYNFHKREEECTERCNHCDKIIRRW